MQPFPILTCVRCFPPPVLLSRQGGEAASCCLCFLRTVQLLSAALGGVHTPSQVMMQPLHGSLQRGCSCIAAGVPLCNLRTPCHNCADQAVKSYTQECVTGDKECLLPRNGCSHLDPLSCPCPALLRCLPSVLLLALCDHSKAQQHTRPWLQWLPTTAGS